MLASFAFCAANKNVFTLLQELAAAYADGVSAVQVSPSTVVVRSLDNLQNSFVLNYLIILSSAVSD
jgi:hypothetical protein